MIPSAAMIDRIPTLLAADDSSLGPAAGPCKVILIDENFTPTNDTVVGDLHECTNSGLGPITCTAGDQQAGIDPVTSEQKVDMIPPIGGWRWEQADGAGLPVTIYGFALVNNAKSTLWGVEKLATPIQIDAVHQTIEIPSVSFRLDASQIH